MDLRTANSKERSAIERIASLYRSLDWKIILLLSLVPILRELVMGLFFAHHGNPFATPKDVIHTLFEMAFMFVIAIGFSWFRFSRHAALQQETLLKKRVGERTAEIRLTQQTAISALAILSEYHDSATGDHLHRIRRYVRALAQWLEQHSPYGAYLGQWGVDDLSLAAIMHDVGKNAVPQAILAKEGKLTAEEFRIVKRHTIIAGEMFDRENACFVDRYGKDSYLALAGDIARCHHERWDGRGYPQGLRGDAIPLAARIVALADVYDALTSERPYKAPWPHEDAVAEILKGRSTQFDPIVVDAFEANAHVFRQIRNTATCAENGLC